MHGALSRRRAPSLRLTRAPELLQRPLHTEHLEKLMKSLLMRPLAALALCLGVAAGLGAPSAHAQSTTGNVSGIVSDDSGGVLPGATVSAKHEPTGTQSSTVTGPDGRFALLNVRVGGPYVVTATL